MKLTDRTAEFRDGLTDYRELPWNKRERRGGGVLGPGPCQQRAGAHRHGRKLFLPACAPSSRTTPPRGQPRTRGQPHSPRSSRPPHVRPASGDDFSLASTDCSEATSLRTPCLTAQADATVRAASSVRTPTQTTRQVACHTPRGRGHLA